MRSSSPAFRGCTPTSPGSCASCSARPNCGSTPADEFRVPSREELRRIGRALRSGDMISILTNSAERETLDRVQAVMAVVEGHAEHVMDVVAPDLLPSLPKLRRALDERRRSQSGLSRVLARLLGMEMKLRQYERGKIFCDAIVEAAGPRALHHVFSAPEALPTFAEIEDPAAWLRRTGLDRPQPQLKRAHG